MSLAALYLGLLTLATAGTPSIPPRIKPGAKCLLRTPDGGWVPDIADLTTYRTFLGAIKVRSLKAIKTLGYGNNLMYLLSGRKVEIVSVFPAPGKPFPADFPLAIPAAEVRSADGLSLAGYGADLKMTRWIPLYYLREEDEPTPSDEPQLPAFEILVDEKAIPIPGKEMYLYADDRFIPVVNGLFAFEDLCKAALARDKAGFQELEEKKQLAWVDPLTRILIIKRHTNEFIADGVHAVECRILDGPYKGNSVWTLETYTVQTEIKVTPISNRRAQKAREAKVSAPLRRARSKLTQAKALERSNPTGALALYRDAVQLLEGDPALSASSELKQAKARIKILGKKP